MTNNRQIMAILFGIVVFSGSIPFSFADVNEIKIQSPKKQLEQGVLHEEIQCRENKVLVIRNNGNPACVYNNTAERLNWNIIATSFIVDAKNDSILISDESSLVELSVSNVINDDDKNILLNDAKITVRSDEPYDDEGIPYGLYSAQNHRAPASPPLNEDQYPEIEIDKDGNLILPTVKRTPAGDELSMEHDKNLNPCDWIPSYIPAGQELKVVHTPFP